MTEASNSKLSIQWLWQANKDPWSDNETSAWKPYSDIENLIIEEAFTAKKHFVALDGYFIDISEQIQISASNKNKQRPITRTIRNNTENKFREERFTPDPMAPKCEFTREYDHISPFILEARKYLRLGRDQYPSKDKLFATVILETAAAGILEEGKSMGVGFEARKLAEILLDKRGASVEDIWKCCAHIYSMESFLYKKINSVMRLIGSESHEPVWRSKVRTLGPFCLLLWDDPFNTLPAMNKKLYRPGKLTNEQIEAYKKMMKSEEAGSFHAFTSTNRTFDAANSFPNTNVIFILELALVFSMNLQSVSLYPAEEEELICPGVYFQVQSVEFDTKTQKHIIHLKLKQDFSRPQDFNLSQSPNPDRNYTYSLCCGF